MEMLSRARPSAPPTTELRSLEPASSEWALDALAEIEATGAKASPYDDARWLAACALSPKFSAKIAVCRIEGRAVGMLPILLYPSRLSLQIGEFVLLSWPVTRLTLRSRPLVAATVHAPQEVIESLFAVVADDLTNDAAVFLESVGEETTLRELLQAQGLFIGRFHALVFGKPYEHRAIALAQSYDGYLRELSSRTRSDLKRTRRRFVEAVSGDYNVRCFRLTEDVPQFLEDAAEVSSKTYQFKLLGAGLRNTEELSRRYRTAAELGWLRCYILYIGEQPAAFQVGLLHRGVFHAQEIGYDPEFAKLQVGIFLHTEILQDLCALEPAVEVFDFGNDDNLHKQRLSTQQRTERYYYLFPRGLRGWLSCNSIQATNALSSRLGRLAERAGFLRQLRGWIRKVNAPT